MDIPALFHPKICTANALGTYLSRMCPADCTNVAFAPLRMHFRFVIAAMHWINASIRADSGTGGVAEVRQKPPSTDTAPITIIIAKTLRRVQRSFALNGLMDVVTKSACAEVSRTVSGDPAIE